MVSIPSMPGRFFRRRGGGPDGEPPGGFNPLDAGALLQTAGFRRDHPHGPQVSIPSMPGRFFRQRYDRIQVVESNTFQSPRCRGASSDWSTNH